MTRRDLTGPASAYRASKGRYARRDRMIEAMRTVVCEGCGKAVHPDAAAWTDDGSPWCSTDCIPVPPDHRPGLTRLHPAETAALDAEAARFAQRRRDERFAAMADYHAGVLPAWPPRPTLRERLLRWITGRG